MNARVWVSITLAGLMALTAPAFGQDADTAAQKWQQADANKDGRVTYEELKAVLPAMTPERFKQLDRNSDAVLTAADRAASGGEAGGKMEKLQQADTNHDGQITFEEAKAAFPRITRDRFQKLDHNGDGVVSSVDMREAGEKLKQADANGDGKVSPEEAKKAFPRMTDARFKKFDRNGDDSSRAMTA